MDTKLVYVQCTFIFIVGGFVRVKYCTINSEINRMTERKWSCSLLCLYNYTLQKIFCGIKTSEIKSEEYEKVYI